MCLLLYGQTSKRIVHTFYCKATYIYCKPALYQEPIAFALRKQFSIILMPMCLVPEVFRLLTFVISDPFKDCFKDLNESYCIFICSYVTLWKYRRSLNY